MTEPEAMVMGWLTQRKIPFSFQTSLAGGFYELGGAVVDFILDELSIALRVMGEYWHKGIEKTGTDMLQKEMLTAMGYTVVDLLESDIQERLDETLRLALTGQEVLR